MSRLTFNQTWSVGGVVLTVAAVGDPAPESWPGAFRPIVEAVEASFAALESEGSPVMRKGALVPSPDPEAPEDASPNGDAHTAP